MSPVRSRAKRLESAISICLLATLFLIGVGIFVKQFDVDMSRFGIDAAIAPNLEIPFDLSSLVPAGFKTLSEIEVYNSENLYEKINGKAPFYTESGFEKLFTQRFISEKDENLWMELFVYDMGSIRNAFSVFSTQRRADATILSLFLTSFGYRTSNALYFVHGDYYIELVGSSESKGLFKAIIETAQKVQANLAVSNVGIPELALLPQEDKGLVQGSVKLYLANAFGFEGLTNTFTAQYKIDGQTVTAFLSQQAGIREAITMADGYRKFLIENGAVTKETTNKILEGKVLDFYDTTEIVLATGPFIVGVHEAENQLLAERLAVKLINKLKEVINSANE